MRKWITYFSFAIASIVVIVAFVTATSYIQLAVAVAVYLVLFYAVCRILLRRTARITHKRPMVVMPEAIKVPEKMKGIADIDKRGFLKLIGAAGVSFLLYSLFSKRVEGPFLEKLTGGKTVGPEGLAGEEVDATSGYRISEIEDGVVTYYGFTNKDGAWFIMREDVDEGSFRYVKGDSRFADNWDNREKLNYDYFHKVF